MTQPSPHHRPEDPMTRIYENAPRHQQIVADALMDWWIEADPTAPFNPIDAADQIDTYLRTSGYTLSRRTHTYTGPGRAQIAFTAFLAVACLAGSLLSLARRDWGWTAIALVGAAGLTHELVEEIAERRRRRRT